MTAAPHSPQHRSNPRLVDTAGGGEYDAEEYADLSGKRTDKAAEYNIQNVHFVCAPRTAFGCRAARRRPMPCVVAGLERLCDVTHYLRCLCRAIMRASFACV